MIKKYQKKEYMYKEIYLKKDNKLDHFKRLIKYFF